MHAANFEVSKVKINLTKLAKTYKIDTIKIFYTIFKVNVESIFRLYRTPNLKIVDRRLRVPNPNIMHGKQSGLLARD